MGDFSAFQITLGHERFFNEHARLVRSDKSLGPRIKKVVELVVSGQLKHPSLNTRAIQGNPDQRFLYVNVSDKYRMVIAVEKSIVYFYSVGNHDDTLRAGEQAALAAHSRFSALSPNELLGDRKRLDQNRNQDEQKQPSLLQDIFIAPTESLARLAENKDKVFDLFQGDILSTLNGYEAGLLEDWMIFLAPDQYRAVERAQSGLLKVSGGPGTGKSVVALHAVKRKLAEHPEAKILVTSFVNTVPAVLANLFARLAGELARQRVEFKTLHRVGWSMIYLPILL